MRASVRLLGRLRPPKPLPEEPVWPRPEPLRSQPFLQLPKTRTQAISFSSSSPLHSDPSPANIGPGITPGGAVVRSEGGEDGETTPTALAEESRIPTRAAVLAKRRVVSDPALTVYEIPASPLASNAAGRTRHSSTTSTSASAAAAAATAPLPLRAWS